MYLSEEEGVIIAKRFYIPALQLYRKKKMRHMIGEWGVTERGKRDMSIMSRPVDWSIDGNLDRKELSAKR